MTELRFMVRGIPQTKGSARAFAYQPKAGGAMRAKVMNDNPKAKAWQADVAKSAWVARGGGRRTPYAGAVHLAIDFYLPTPQKPKADAPVTKPDLDKLLRCVLDGLSGVIFIDDSQVVSILSAKHYAGTSAPGCDILVRPADRAPMLNGLG